MKKLSLLALSVVFLLSACSAPNFQNQSEVVQSNKTTNQKAIIPKYQISSNYYRTLLPFQPSASRGMVVANLNTRYDIDEFETGLMRVAQKQFDPSKYVFREGQELNKNTLSLWLNRQFTKAQLAQQGLTASQNIGLNPLDTKGDNSTPVYLSQILEQDYLIKGSNNTVQLGGVVIGLALNSTYYYQTIQYGPTYDTTIPDNVINTQGKAIADQVISRLRNMNDLKNVPITIALFKEQSKSSVVPGNFFAYANVDSNSSTISGWNNINEKYYLFPSTAAQTDHRDDATAFTNFEQDVEQYFPNFTGVIGTGFYVDDQLQSLKISVPIQFYGKTETIGFVQYIAGLLNQYFPKYVSVSVSVTSADGPEALIDRQANANDPYVYIY